MLGSTPPVELNCHDRRTRSTTIDATSTIRNSLELAHTILVGMMADCPPEVRAHRFEGATIQSIDAIYAHMTLNEDRVVQGIVRQQPTVFESGGWAERLGVESWESLDLTGTYDYALFEEYAATVRAATMAFFDSATPADHARMTVSMFGEMPAIDTIATNVLMHIVLHGGEISAQKGILGLKGLPI